eukprot:3938760-Rhodomonas_salina.1
MRLARVCPGDDPSRALLSARASLRLRHYSVPTGLPPSSGKPAGAEHERERARARARARARRESKERERARRERERESLRGVSAEVSSALSVMRVRASVTFSPCADCDAASSTRNMVFKARQRLIH